MLIHTPRSKYEIRNARKVKITLRQNFMITTFLLHQKVINTKALILNGNLNKKYYIAELVREADFFRVCRMRTCGSCRN